MSSVRLDALSKSFGATPAVQSVDLEIASGEFFSILGPSGCGKSTLLRMIAGLDLPTSGRIFFDDREVTQISPQERNVGMVFQNYALFPHMTAGKNIAFGLETKNVPAVEIRKRVTSMLTSVQLSAKEKTPVTFLSGGEQQRVAVARALVISPSLLLFDEPLSNLDASLRVSTREEIRTLQRAAGITAIYVTHDQSEAMSLSDRVAVLRQGRLEQVGTPTEIYEHPATSFVAEFVGGANIIEGELIPAGFIAGGIRVSRDGLSDDFPSAGPCRIAVKPEDIALAPAGEASNGIVLNREYLGFLTSFRVQCGALVIHSLMFSASVPAGVTEGTRVTVSIDGKRATCFGPPR